MNSFKLAFAFWIFCLISLINGNKAIGQITPDETVPTEVERSGNILEITGGSEAGDNLFHSFKEFSVPTGQEAFFNNANNIVNIFSRVTGSSISEIDGLIRTNGNANLFLLNPNGIIFGENSSLNIGGSFVATTADSFVFQDGTIFDTQNPEAPLLTVNIPVGLQIGADAGSIINQSTAGLEINSTRNMTFVGGNITFDGGKLTAPGGKVNLAGLSTPGLVEFDENNSLNFSPEALLSNVLLDNGAKIDVRADNGGSININANNFSIESESSISAGIEKNQGTIESQAGDININATGTVSIINGSSLANSVSSEAIGKSGNINIKTGSLFLDKKAGISTNIGGQGSAGDIQVEATESVFVNDSSLLTASIIGRGDAGNISIRADNSLTLDGLVSGIESVVNEGAVGQGGNIDINAQSLSINNGASIRSFSLGDGNAGSINIKAIESIVVSGTAPFILENGVEVGGFSSGILSNTDGFGGTGGQINVNTQNLRLSDGGVISSRSRNSSDGGNIIINAQTLDIINGGQILTTAFGRGNAGDVTLNVSDRLTISGGDPTYGDRFERVAANFDLEQAEIIIDPVNALSGIYANADSESTGDSGDVFIYSERLDITNNARISVSNWGEGNGGSLLVKSNTISLSDSADLLAATLTGERGNITLETNSLNLSGASRINTDAQSTDGGNIFIDTDTLVALENSDITANARQGRGGRVTIDARGIFGTQFRDFPTSQSDITASSSLGSQFNGIVEINITNANLTEGLSKLPNQPIGSEPLQSCQAQKNLENSRFINTGRGGLPISPDEVNSNSVWEDLRSINSNSDRSFSKNITDNVFIEAEPEKIVEAQGWIVNSKGNIVLTAQPSITTSNRNNENNYATCFIFK